MAKRETAAAYFSVRQLCHAALMGAFVFLMTIVPRIPIPLGYAHLGDTAIFLGLVFAGRREAVLSGCLGSALADLLGGFPLWIGPTLIIKFLMAETFWQIAKTDIKKANISSIRMMLGLVVAAVVMAVGYALFGAVLYESFVLGLSSLPGLLAEGIVNIAAFYPAAMALKRIKARR